MTVKTVDAARGYSALDRLLIAAQSALATTLGPPPAPQVPYPAEGHADAELDEAARRHAAGLMRINHAGEVAAQALYLGQAAVARHAELRAHLLEAAREEADHLAWCAARLDELGSRPSVLNPLWYAGAFAIGAGAGLVSDRISLGFVVETERQVEAHLGDHLERLPEGDARSRAIVATMQADEARHGRNAEQAGAEPLPDPVPALMRIAADLMRFAAYRV
jgi:ubiquinone biosynthesis monooxygenase Coq7